jgi:hypothetical protein
MAKFKDEVVWYAEKMGNHKDVTVFRVDESNVQLHWKHMAVISKCEVSSEKFTGPKKGRIPEIDDAVLKFFQKRCKTGVKYIVFFLWQVWLSTADLIYMQI